jgi:hypothetical protein
LLKTKQLSGQIAISPEEPALSLKKGTAEIRAVQISGLTAFVAAQLAECVEENAGKRNEVG